MMDKLQKFCVISLTQGGRHADNTVDLQEFMIMPTGAENMEQAIRMCAEVYQFLRIILKQKGLSTAVGDEGGFAPDLSDSESVLEVILEAVKKAGYEPGKDISIAIDAAAIFKTRIELRQIGVRDETKILGGIGICGRCLCCHTYLSEFAPVSIKMAKEQNLSLNQTKISGVCGRLMCCLKNEQETYEELNKKLPGLGDTVTTPDGLTGTVHSVNVLRQRVKVIVEINDEKEIQEFPVDDLKFRPRKKKVKVSEKELKELGNLEDKKGDSKLND